VTATFVRTCLAMILLLPIGVRVDVCSAEPIAQHYTPQATYGKGSGVHRDNEVNRQICCIIRFKGRDVVR
jgi:hypothetical protein